MTFPPPNVDWARAKAVFGELVEAAPHARLAELDRLCDDDDALRSAVVGLLEAFDQGTGFLSDSNGAASPMEHPPPTEQVGRYRIVGELGRGGMGTVYEAIQEQPRRTVALKLLHASISSRRTRERFIREADLLAHLDHPNIARVYEAGTDRDGLGGIPFFAMEFIEDARPIAHYAEAASLSAKARVELFLPVCDAVRYGHQRGIIHRDLKPGNILVGGRDQRPRVIDFGVARITDADLSMATLDTGAHEIIGTLRYMSPEQCRGNAHEVDVRSDVYALGLVLYETLMGQLPYDLKSTSLLDIPRVISEEPPRRLSAQHDGDLETIVLKALEKSRERRYQSVGDLAADLRRYLAGEPIEAKRDRKWYVLRKTMWRYRTGVAVAAAFFLLVASAAVALAVLFTRAEHNATVLRRVGYFQSIALAEHALDSARSDELRRLLEACPVDLRGWEWRYLNGRIDESVATLYTSPYAAAALSPDGTMLASGTRGGIVEIWDLARQDKEAEYQVGAGYFESMSFSPDGTLLAIGTRATSPSFVIDTRTGDVVLELQPSEQVKSVLVHPDGARLITGSSHGVLATRSIKTGEILQTLTSSGQWVTSLAVSPDGETIASGRNNGKVELWDAATGQPRFQRDGAHEARVSGLAFSVDGDWLYSSGWDAAVKTWDHAGIQIDVRLVQDADLVRSVATSPNGDMLAVATSSSVELRRSSDGTLVRRVIGQTNGYGARFQRSSPDGRQLVTWSNESAKIWNLDLQCGAYVLGHRHTQWDSVAVTPDGRRVASAARGGRLLLWDTQERRVLAEFNAPTTRVYRLEFSPDGTRLAGACHDGVLRVWSLAERALLHQFEAGRRLVHVQWQDDDLVLAADPHGSLSAWSCADEARRWQIDTEQNGLTSVAARPGVDRIATGGRDGTIKVWSTTPTAPMRVIQGHDRAINDLSWAPDGALLASGGNDGVIRLWDDAGRLHTELVGHGRLIKGVAFTPDGTRLASSAWEGEIRVWETDEGTCVLRLRGHVGVVMDVDFTADGHRLLSAGNDGTVRVWEAIP